MNALPSSGTQGMSARSEDVPTIAPRSPPPGRTIRELVVFLGGAGDVDEEFRLAYDGVDFLNRAVLPRLRIRLSLVTGAVDAPAGAGRPQSRINPCVDTCDLASFAIYRRHGTPTGTHDSGTEEEFDRAVRRWQTTGRPEILVFLRRLRAVDLADQSEQAARSRAFRERIHARGLALTVAYKNSEEFQRKFMEQLMQWTWGVYDGLSGGGSAQRQRMPPRRREPAGASGP